jgi:hypothetical protein
MDHTFPESVRKAIDERTEAIFELRKVRSNGKSSGVLHHFALQDKSMESVNLTKDWLLR